MKNQVHFCEKLNTQIKCVFSRNGREMIHISTSKIDGWEWKEYRKIDPRYSTVDVSINKNGIKIPFPQDGEWSIKAVTTALIDAGRQDLCVASEAEAILKERAEAEAKALAEAEAQAKALSEAEEQLDGFINSLAIGEEYRIKVFRHYEMAQLVEITGGNWKTGKMGRFRTKNQKEVFKRLSELYNDK